MQQPQPPPGIPAFKPSGHPDLLRTREGAILSFSDTGAAETLDGGRSWVTLSFAGRPGYSYSTGYYPYAIQGPNGEIYVFSSDGWDIPYGAFDESIEMDKFYLQDATLTALAPTATTPTTLRVASPTAPTTGTHPVTVSHAALAGVSAAKAKLAFTLTASRHASPIDTIKIALPAGLQFSSDERSLSRGITVEGVHGRPIAFAPHLSNGRLVIVLRAATREARVTIASLAVHVAQPLAALVKHQRLHALEVIVEVTELNHDTTRLPLELGGR
jgi:hypothetical protein